MTSLLVLALSCGALGGIAVYYAVKGNAALAGLYAGAFIVLVAVWLGK